MPTGSVFAPSLASCSGFDLVRDFSDDEPGQNEPSDHARQDQNLDAYQR